MVIDNYYYYNYNYYYYNYNYYYYYYNGYYKEGNLNKVYNNYSINY